MLALFLGLIALTIAILYSSAYDKIANEIRDIRAKCLRIDQMYSNKVQNNQETSKEKTSEETSKEKTSKESSVEKFQNDSLYKEYYENQNYREKYSNKDIIEEFT